MPLDKTFNLVDAKRPTRDNPALIRRARTLEQIDAQLALLAGGAPDDAGTDGAQATAAQTSRPGRGAWWWQDESGGFLLAVKYARRPLELAKGKFAVKCGSLDDVRAALTAIQAEVMKGELDAQLTKAAADVRAGFGQTLPRMRAKQPT